MDILKKLEAEVVSAEMERNAVKERTAKTFKEFDENKRELERLFRLKEKKDDKLFMARVSLLNHIKKEQNK